MKKIMLSLGAVLGSIAAFADNLTTDNSIVQVSDVTGIFEEAQSSMASLIEAALPVVIAFVGGGLIIWGALALVSLLKRGLSAGKGR